MLNVYTYMRIKRSIDELGPFFLLVCEKKIHLGLKELDLSPIHPLDDGSTITLRNIEDAGYLGYIGMGSDNQVIICQH